MEGENCSMDKIDDGESELSYVEYYIQCYGNEQIRKNTILFVPRYDRELSGNITGLLVELQKEKYKDYKVYFSCDGEKEIRKKIKLLFSHYGIKNVILVRRGENKYMELLASAQYLVTDAAFDSCYIKKEGQVIINTWNGTPLKAMGKDEAKCCYTYGNIQKNLIIADYLISSCKFMADTITDAFGLENLSNGTVLYSGYPKNAVFFDKERSVFMRDKLGFEGKNVFVYMPTWRGTDKRKDTIKTIDTLRYYFQELDEKLNDNDLLLLKLHPAFEKNISLSRYKHIAPFPTGYETNDVINAADGLVTDYSSVLFDFANTRKKIILFPYDYEAYRYDRGVYIDFEQMPFPVVYNASDLADEMHSAINYDDTEFLEKYCTYDRSDAAKVICERVFFGLKGCDEVQVKNNGKENVIIFVATLPLNGLTGSVLNLFNNLDLAKRNYYACVIGKQMVNYPERMKKLPDGVGVIVIEGGFISTKEEQIALDGYYLRNKKNKSVIKLVDNFYRREAERYFGGFIYHHCVQFFGYDKNIINLCEKMHGNRSIFVHNDMLQEIATRGNQHELTLRKAYSGYDHVAAVSVNAHRTSKILGATKRNAVIVNNCIDYDGIYKRGFEEISYSDTTVSNVSDEQLKEILESKAKKFVTIGRYSPEKGHPMLLDAFNRFYRENQDSYLIIIGGHGDEYNNICAKASSLDAKEHIILIKSLLNPMPILKRCDLFVMSSYYEGLPLVLFEAVIQGLPVMSTDIMGPHEFVKTYGGLLTDVSAEGIYEGLCKFVSEGIKPCEIDFKEYNKKAVSEFEGLLA